MNISIGNLSSANSNISSMISNLIAKRSSSLSSLMDQKTTIENSLASLQNSALGTGTINNSYSSQIASIQNTIDSLKEQYTVNANKLSSINSLTSSYKKTVSSLDDYINSLKNPTSGETALTWTNTDSSVAEITNLSSSAGIKRVELSVTQLATSSVLKSEMLKGGTISTSTKITDLYAGTYDSVKNSITSTRKDLSADMKLSSLGVTSGSFKLGSNTITVNKDETLGDLMTKINGLSGYTANITTTYDSQGNATSTSAISATSGKSIAITNNTDSTATNFTSIMGVTVSQGDFTINGATFNIDSTTTIGSLLTDINRGVEDGVGAKLESNKLVLVASTTGEVEINIGKGSSNFTNAIGLTTGGVMNTSNLVMGSDGSYITLKGNNSGISTTDSVSGNKFTTGNFTVSYNQIDANGVATATMLTTEINVTSSDNVQSIINKIKSQTQQTYTDKNGNSVTTSLTAEVVDGKFQIRQTEKGSQYQISVQGGSSTFTEYVGLTQHVNEGTATTGSSTTFTGINSVSTSTTFNAGNFKITASAANDPTTTQTATI